ncbi:MAG: peptidase M23, partial [Propionivibrio sp.]
MKLLRKALAQKPPVARLSRGSVACACACRWSAVALIVLSAMAPSPTPAAGKKSKAPTRADVLEKKGDLKEIRGQIESLRKGMAVTEDKRADAADEVKEIDQAISTTQRELARLNKSRDALQATLNDLSKQSQALEKRLTGQQEPLAKLVYRQYVQGSSDSLRLLLNGDNPNQVARDLQYLTIIGQARRLLLRDIEATLQRKQVLADDARARAEDLAAVEAKQKTQHGKLVAQRQQRKVVLDKLAATVSEQKRKIGDLQRNERQLSQLIKRLTKAIATQPARQPKRKSIPETPPGTNLTKGINNNATPEPVSFSNFAQLKGRLRLPARGVVTNRFGGRRQEGSTWKGLFI